MKGPPCAGRVATTWTLCAACGTSCLPGSFSSTARCRRCVLPGLPLGRLPLRRPAQRWTGSTCAARGCWSLADGIQCIDGVRSNVHVVGFTLGRTVVTFSFSWVLQMYEELRSIERVQCVLLSVKAGAAIMTIQGASPCLKTHSTASLFTIMKAAHSTHILWQCHGLLLPCPVTPWLWLSKAMLLSTCMVSTGHSRVQTRDSKCLITCVACFPLARAPGAASARPPCPRASARR